MTGDDGARLQDEIDRANVNVQSARGLLEGFEHCSIEAKHGAIIHAISELENARRKLPDDY